MIPERFAIGMCERGWWLRNKICWHKKNPMPSSVKDRFSCTYEFLYFFTKAARYWFDLDAVRRPIAESSIKRVALMDSRVENKAGSQELSSEVETVKTLTNNGDSSNSHQRYKAGQGAVASRGDNVDHLVARPHPLGANPGDCWDISTFPFPEAHYATYPPELIRKPIRAGCPLKVCTECGRPWRRIVEWIPGVSKECPKTQAAHEARGGTGKPTGTVGKSGGGRIDGYSRTIGWQPTCTCNAGYKPGIILDPFVGSGTSLVVVIEEGRRGVGIDLSEEYCEMARRRCDKAARAYQPKLIR